MTHDPTQPLFHDPKGLLLDMAQEQGLARTEIDPDEIEARTRDLVYEGTIAFS